MSTNYTFYLGPPTSKGEGRRGERRVMAEQRRDKKREATINLETRGFSARATECRRDSTIVEVETGPNFSGIVGAETKEDIPGCFLKGSSSSKNSSYSLVMNHEKCGSKRNASSVWTYVVVQESGAILTHSTRRCPHQNIFHSKYFHWVFSLLQLWSLLSCNQHLFVVHADAAGLQCFKLI